MSKNPLTFPYCISFFPPPVWIYLLSHTVVLNTVVGEGVVCWWEVMLFRCGWFIAVGGSCLLNWKIFCLSLSVCLRQTGGGIGWKVKIYYYFFFFYY